MKTIFQNGVLGGGERAFLELLWDEYRTTVKMLSVWRSMCSCFVRVAGPAFVVVATAANYASNSVPTLMRTCIASRELGERSGNEAIHVI
ncbi:hypothetical protein V3C99_003173 [Haemonchus contortus]